MSETPRPRRTCNICHNLKVEHPQVACVCARHFELATLKREAAERELAALRSELDKAVTRCAILSDVNEQQGAMITALQRRVNEDVKQ